MIDRGYLFQPDFEVRNQIRMIGGMPDLRQFDRIFISCSGGKDSQVMSYIIAELADKQNYDKSKIELVYADTGLEWHDTYKHVQAIGAALGIKTVQVLPKYKLLDNVRRRWEMFKNGTKNAEREREDTNHLAARTEAWQVRSRIMPSDSAIQTTNEHQSTSLSVPVSTDYVLSKSRKTVSNGLVYQNVGGGGDKSDRPFPSQFARFCTSWGKQAPMLQYCKSVSNSESEILYGRGEEQSDCGIGENIRYGGRLGTVTYLMCSGERWEESSKRSTYPEWSIHEQLTTKKRKVYRWRPMLAYEKADVWSAIKESGIDCHEAYKHGCDRLGCTMCIFAGECGRMAKDVQIACRENPEQYEELDKLETETGYTMSISGARVRDIVKKGKL